MDPGTSPVTCLPWPPDSSHKLTQRPQEAACPESRLRLLKGIPCQSQSLETESDACFFRCSDTNAVLQGSWITKRMWHHQRNKILVTDLKKLRSANCVSKFKIIILKNFSELHKKTKNWANSGKQCMKKMRSATKRNHKNKPKGYFGDKEHNDCTEKFHR